MHGEADPEAVGDARRKLGGGREQDGMECQCEGASPRESAAGPPGAGPAGRFMTTKVCPPRRTAAADSLTTAGSEGAASTIAPAVA